jgi:hypothetical protein
MVTGQGGYARRNLDLKNPGAGTGAGGDLLHASASVREEHGVIRSYAVI